MGESKKISTAEAVLMALIVGGADLLEGATGLMSLIPLIGTIFVFLSWIIDITVWALVQFWLIMKGVKGMWFLAGSLIEFIPFLDILPIRTVTIFLTIYLANHPKAAGVAGAATGKMEKVKTAS